MMELTLLTVRACPHAAIFEERLAAALASHPRGVVHPRPAAAEREAAEAGGHRAPAPLTRRPGGGAPSPPGARPPRCPAGLSGEARGRAGGAPRVEARRRARAKASGHG